jgi:hypothetical protein
MMKELVGETSTQMVLSFKERATDLRERLRAFLRRLAAVERSRTRDGHPLSTKLIGDCRQ